MENRNGQGIFYGVIGVATLVVAIIGATFAYFSATGTSNTNFTGEASAAGLTVAIERVDNSATEKLIPLNTGDLGKAITGHSGTACEDEAGNTACHLYKVTVSTVSTATITVNGTITFTTGSESGFNALKWVNLSNATTTTDSMAAYGSQASNDAIGGTPVTTLESNVTLVANSPRYYYILVYIENSTTTAQDTTNYGTYYGTVTFNAGDSGQVSATFS